MSLKKILMAGPSKGGRGGISSVIDQYFKSELINLISIRYVDSHCDKSTYDKFIVAILSYIRFVHLIIFFKPDIVHLHSASRASFYRKSLFVLLSMLFEKKIVFHLHGGEFMDFYSASAFFPKKAYIRFILKHCDTVLVLSKSWASKISSINCFIKTEVLHNSVLRPSCVSPKNTEVPIIVFMGKVVKGKGVEELINACFLLKQEGALFKCFICGDGKLSSWKKLSSKYGLDNHLFFKGWVGESDKVVIYNSAAVFVLPSYNEGMPMSVIEALSYGVPVIASNVGGIPDVVKNGINGFIVKPKDAEGLYQRLSEVINNPDITQALRENANRSFFDFDLNNSIDKLMVIYNSL